MEKSINKKLRTDPIFNPFNKAFDFKIVKDFVEKQSVKYDKSNFKFEAALSSCLMAYYLNPLFTEVYKSFKHRFETSNLTSREILYFLVIISNRNYIILHSMMSEHSRNQSSHHYLDAYRYQVDSTDESIGKVDAKNFIEGDVDNLMNILNYLRFFENENFKTKKNHISEIESVSNILSLALDGSFYNTIKQTYDDAIWNRGYLYYNSEEKKIVVDYHSHDEEKLLRVGHIRLFRNSFGTYLNHLDLNQNKKFNSPFEKFKNSKRIKNVYLNNGYIGYKLAKGVDKLEADNEIKLLSELETYYPFIKNEKFPNFKEINLRKFLVMFCSLRHLTREVVSKISIVNDEIQEIEDFYKFPFRIKVEDLKRYLSIKLKFSSKQINSFLSLLEVKFDKKNRIDLWDRPLIRYDDEYIFTLIGINDSIIVHLLDIWLNDGGFSLDRRGKMLEDYIKETIANQIKRKRYYYYIPEKSNFEIPGKGKEEIDLLLNLKNCLIVAEVKCIKYPIKKRDYHNAYKRLMQAANQVIRKTEFIIKNKDYFDKEVDGIDDKKIVKLVITNFPNFSGFIINDVPIVDLFLLEAYILSGKLSKRKIQFRKNKSSRQDEVETIKFYKNEDEFSNNFDKTMREHPAIEEIKSAIEVIPTKKSLDNSGIDFYVFEPIVIGQNEAN